MVGSTTAATTATVWSNNIGFYCWSYRHKCNHNGSYCTHMCQERMSNATTHVGTNGNTVNSERVIFTS